MNDTSARHDRWMLAFGYACGRVDGGDGEIGSPDFAAHYSESGETGNVRQSYDAWCKRMRANEVARERGLEYAAGMEEDE